MSTSIIRLAPLLLAVASAAPAPNLESEGRLAFEQGRYRDALKVLGGRDDVFVKLVQDTLRLTQGSVHVESEHFIFTYPPGKDAVLAPYALETLEKMRAALGEDFGFVPPEKVRVEVFNDGHELSSVSTLTYQQIKTTGTIAICKFNKLMITSPKAVLRGYDWQDTLAHEYVHWVVSRATDDRTPVWLQEGLAKYFESRWRGGAGLSMSPSTLSLLGQHLKSNRLITFAQMYPSMAMLPTAEDAATAFAEVFFAIDYWVKTYRLEGLRSLFQWLRNGLGDQAAIERTTQKSFERFQLDWREYLKTLTYPAKSSKVSEVKVVLKEGAGNLAFGDFVEVQESGARRMAHLGELMRQQNRIKAAVTEYAKAYQEGGDGYESISDKYALSLVDTGNTELAAKVLRSSLRDHPSSPALLIHLGRINLKKERWNEAKTNFLEALSSDPFDPEIHLSLLRIYRHQGNSALAARTHAAAKALTELSDAEIDRY